MMSETAVERPWDQLAKPWQVMPDGDWSTWVIEAGRGAGKTRAGAEATLRVAQEASRLITTGKLASHEARLAVIGQTMHFVRGVMVDGASGLLRCSPAGFDPVYVPSQRKIVYPGGVEIRLFSADEPERLGGLQFMWIWCDGAGRSVALDNATGGLRLGPHPRRLITSDVDAIGEPRSYTRMS